MTEDLVIGAVSLAIAAVLIFLGWPSKSGESPRFLRFQAAMVVYPPIILVFLVGGIAELVTALLRMPR